MWLSPILYVLVFILVCVRIYKYMTHKPIDNFPPGPPRLPILGSYWFCLLINFNFIHVSLMRWAKKYGNIYGLYLGDFPAVIVCDYDTCKEVLNRPEFDGKPDIMPARLRSYGLQKLGIFFTDGPFWHEQRRFSLRYMRDCGFGRRFETLETLMAEQIQTVVDFIKYAKFSEQDADILRPDGCIFFPDLLYPCLLNSILNIFGMEPTIQNTDKYRYYRHVGRGMMLLQRGIHVANALSLTPWTRHFAPDLIGYSNIMKSNDILFPFFKNIIEEITKTRMDDDEVRNFIDIYLDKMKTNAKDANNTFSNDQLLMILIDYTFPAVTNIPSMIVQVIYLMFHYPQVLDKMQKEIDNVVGRGRLPTLDDRQHLPYTESVVREVLRKETLLPAGIPHRVMEDTTLRGYNIPKNTLVYTMLLGAHNDKKIWGDPENFRPERFITASGNFVKRDHSIPFGAGKRLCAGETFSRNTLFLLVSGLFQNFTFHLPPGVKVPNMNDKIPATVNSQKDLCWIRAIPRD